MFRRLLDRTPSGYRPGVTLEHVRRNLGREALGGAVTTADGLRVEVAERVESAEVLAILAELGVNYAQGFYLAEPKPLSEFPHKIHTGSWPAMRGPERRGAAGR